MSFNFQKHYLKQQKPLRQSKGLQELINELDNNSEHEDKKNIPSNQIDFSKFDDIQKSKSSYSKSFLSELYHKPKIQSIAITDSKKIQNQQDNENNDNNTSRDIEQISYYLNNPTNNQINDSFQFQRSLSFQQSKQQNQRYSRLKTLLLKSKKNNLDAFYRNIESSKNQQNQGNKQFKNKQEFIDYVKIMKYQKKQEEVNYEIRKKENKISDKNNNKNNKMNLFGEEGVDAFKKKKQIQGDNNIGQILPIQFLQDNDDQDQDNFFNSNQLQGQQFFNINKNIKLNNVIQKGKQNLEPIRQQIVTILDHSTEQKKFQDLIKNYNSMKNNYAELMYQLKETSQGQFKIMDEMQKIKQNYHNVTSYQKNQQKQQQNQQNQQIEESKRLKKQQKDKLKQIKQQQLADIKNQIHSIKNNKNQNDLVYLKINQKIQELQKIVRMALSEVQQEKHQKQNFVPKVINYYDDRANYSKSENINQYSQNLNLSRQSSRLYEISPNQQNFKQQAQIKLKPPSKNPSQKNSNQNSQIRSQKRPQRQQQRSLNYDMNVSREQLNFIDDFSSPLQLDLSVDQKNVTEEVEQCFEIAFNPPEYGLEFLPLKLDQGDTKNLRNILTQKSSIIYESFQFIITVRYSMQPDDEVHPVIGKIKIANKCAIDLLDVFIIVYGHQGQNIEISPSKVYVQKLKYNSNINFEVRLDKVAIEDNGFNIQICYKTDSITKKKINFKALLPIVQLIRPQFCYEENFHESWNIFKNQIYITPKKLNFKHIRNHEDLKLVLPFIHITEQDPSTFSYGLMFRYPKSKTMFLLKIACYVNGKASIHLRSDRNGDQKLKQQLLNVLNFLFLL